MYEVFDNFLATETWSSTHPLDEKRFDEALNKIIDNEEFSPSRMGDYFFDKVDNENLAPAIQRYVDRAYIIKEFLNNTGR